jgi:hypothetical protein
MVGAAAKRAWNRLRLGGSDHATAGAQSGEQKSVLDADSLKAIEAAVVRAIAPPVEEVPAPAWLRRVVARWPAVAAALTRCKKAAGAVISARWPLALAGTALCLLLMAAISLSASVAQRQQDVFIARELSTPAGVAVLALAPRIRRSPPSQCLALATHSAAAALP